MKYLQDKLRLIKISRDQFRQDTGLYPGPEPRPELRPNYSGKLCIRSQDKLQKHIAAEYQIISINLNMLENSNELEILENLNIPTVHNTNVKNVLSKMEQKVFVNTTNMDSDKIKIVDSRCNYSGVSTLDHL